MRRTYFCRRCQRSKGKYFMVSYPSGFPSNLCLECEAKDRIKQEDYAAQQHTVHG